MRTRIIMANALVLVLGLSLVASGIAMAQSGSPLRGIPHMSNEPNGPEMERFPAGSGDVYLVFEYETEEPIEIVAEVRSDSQQGAVIFQSRETYSGSGTANIQIEGAGSDPLPEDRYTTIIRFRRAEGGELYPTAGWEWVVGDVPLSEDDPTGAEAPISPLEAREEGTGSEGASTDTSLSQSQSSQSAATPAQATTAPGFSPAILIGIGVVVLILISVIVWAVRGFMTAA